MYPDTFDEYQDDSAETNLHPPALIPPLVYYALAINEEAGELAGKVKKIYRDRDGIMADGDKEALIDEMGDVLWYLTRLCEVIEVPLSMIAFRNLVKLTGRVERGTIRGSGDKR